MSQRVLLSAGLALVAVLTAAPNQPAATAPYSPMVNGAQQGGLLDLVDARSYHHCHNMPRRIRCHKKERLPVNWPPNTDTPSTSSLRDWHAKGACRDHRRRPLR